MKLLLTIALCLVSAAVAFPASPDDTKKQEKRGLLSALSLPAYSAPLALPAPAAYHAPLALSAPAAYHAPLALSAPAAYHAPIALPAPAYSAPLALPAAYHAAPIALPAPAYHAPIALPAIAPAIKTVAAPLTLPSLSYGKYW